MIKHLNAVTLIHNPVVVRLTVAGDAVVGYSANPMSDRAVDLIEALAIWLEHGGSEEEFDSAITYLDSIR